MRYTPEQLAAIKSIPVEDVLVGLGYSVQRTGRDMICSPFRSETTGSFHINRTTNTWCDFGLSPADSIRSGKSHTGGDVISLVMQLKSCKSREAMDILAEMRPGISEGLIETVHQKSDYQATSETRVVEVVDLYAITLKRYLTEERCIPQNIAQRYCKEVRYKDVYPGQPEPENTRFAIGFPNNLGNWVIRSQYTSRETGEVKQVKRNIGAGAPTFIGKDGSFRKDGVPTTGNVAVFEGFCDYMSWLAWRQVEVPGTCDVVVLNSTANATFALDYICQHKGAYLYLDNDNTGNVTTQALMDVCAERGVSAKDCRGLLGDCNDINDAWRKALDEAKQSQEQSTSHAHRR